MISGLTITQNFITSEYEDELVKNISAEPWNAALKRRTQHYGYEYNYTNFSISEEDFLGEFPDWLKKLTDYIVDEGKLEKRPDQVIINEYLPGQGISAHTDKTKIFDDHIYSLSLGSNAVMTYSNNSEKHDIFLKKKSFLEMTGDARYKWKHGIPARKSDTINGNKYLRGTRYSITWRNVVF